MYVFDFEKFSMSKKYISNNDWIFMDPDLMLGVVVFIENFFFIHCIVLRTCN